MADTLTLFKHWPAERVVSKLNEALEYARSHPDVTWGDLQYELHIGSDEAMTIHDWLADNFLAKPHLCEHHIRAGRRYVRNNDNPNFDEMELRLHVGHRTAFLIMLELERRGVIHIYVNNTFAVCAPKTTPAEFDTQMLQVAKKYRMRCEPELIERWLYVSREKAIELATRGREELGLRWRGIWTYTPFGDPKYLPRKKRQLQKGVKQ